MSYDLPQIHSDPLNRIGPGMTLAGFMVLLLVIVGCLFCVGYCCCFNCYDY